MATIDDKRKALVNQIPSGGTAPAADGSQNSLAGSEFGRQSLNTISALSGGAGGLASAAVGGLSKLAAGGGVLARMAAASPTAAAAGPYVPPALGIAGLAAASGPGRAAPPAPTATMPVPTQDTGATLPGNPTAPPLQANAPTPPAPTGLGFAGVKKTVGPDGRTLYSDGNAGSDASLMARGPISAQNMRAADALAASNQQDSTGRVQAAANKEQYDREVASAQSTMQAQFDRIKPMSKSQAATQGIRVQQQALQQQGAQQGAIAQLAQRRFGLDEQRSGAEQTALGFQNRAAGRLEELQAAYSQAAPADRAGIAEQIRVLSGKDKAAPPNRYTVVPGGQEWDATAGAMRNVPAQVLDNQQGQFVQPGQSAQPARAPAAPPQAALDMLRRNPNLAANFDAKYGAGAAARVMEQK